MQIKDKFKAVFPHLLAVIIFLSISVIYFYPILEGKVLHTNDGTVAKNNSKEIRDFREKYGREPLWTNALFSGMPAYMISVKYPGNLMKHADNIIRFIKMPISTIFLTMLGFYILLLIFRVRPWLAIAGAIAYGLSTYFFFILTAGHNTKAIAIAYMAPVIGGIYFTYRYNAIKGALLTTFFLTLEIIANHPQITYYAFICILILIITEFVFSIRKKELAGFIKRSVILLVPLLLSVGMNFASLSTTMEYGKYSIRGKSDLVTNDSRTTSGLDKAYATQWSYGVDETLTLLIPNFKGGACRPFDRDSETAKVLRQNNVSQALSQIQRYWGTQPWVDGPVYVGALVVFLFIFGLVIIKGPEKWWLLAATVLSIMLAWGKNFMPLTDFFLDYFPGYNKFRAVTMTLVIAEFCIPLLGILALRDIFQGITSRKDFMKGLKIAFAVTGGITLLFALFPGLAGSFLSPAEKGGQLPAWLSSAIISDRQALLRGDAIRSFLFIALGAATILGFHYGKLKKGYAITALALLFLIDMFTVDKRYLNSDNFSRPAVAEKESAPSVADSEILEDTTYYRVLNLSVNTFSDNSTTSLYHKSIGGYHGAKLSRYNELIDSVLLPEIQGYYKAMEGATTIRQFEEGMKNLAALNMLNTKYLIIAPDAPPAVNKYAFGNAWFAESVDFADDANEELAKTRITDPRRVAVVDQAFNDMIPKSSFTPARGDTISLLSYQPDELVYKYNASGERLAVFSEIYYPAGWEASIDGNRTEYFRTDYVLRGMILPAGSHEVRFTFRPSSYYTGNTICLASSIIFFILAAGYIIYEFINRNKAKDNGAS